MNKVQLIHPEQTHFPFRKNDLTMGSYGWPSETELQDLLSEMHGKTLREEEKQKHA